MLQASQCNYKQCHEVKEERIVHEEPTRAEKTEAREEMKAFAAYLCGHGNAKFVSQMLRYRVATDDALMENMYKFIYLIQKKKIQFTYSPQYGISLWPHDVGFQRMPEIEDSLRESSHFFFNDYITETTTFLTYHIDFRFQDVFDKSFRYAFLAKSMHTLLTFGKQLNRARLVHSMLKSSVLMLSINEI